MCVRRGPCNSDLMVKVTWPWPLLPRNSSYSDKHSLFRRRIVIGIHHRTLLGSMLEFITIDRLKTLLAYK